MELLHDVAQHLGPILCGLGANQRPQDCRKRGGESACQQFTVADPFASVCNGNRPCQGFEPLRARKLRVPYFDLELGRS